MRRGAPEILLVRHGETAWTISGQHTGRSDIPLTEQGRRQGTLLGRRIVARTFELALTSPLQRAAETCRLAGLGGEVQQREELIEWDYGRYEGRTTADIRNTEPEWSIWRDGCPEGEFAADVGRRLEQLIEELRALEGDAIIFAHGHLLRVLTARWLGLPAEFGSAFGLSTCTISILGRERETPVVWLWNDDNHLVIPAEGHEAQS